MSSNAVVFTCDSFANPTKQGVVCLRTPLLLVLLFFFALVTGCSPNGEIDWTSELEEETSSDASGEEGNPFGGGETPEEEDVTESDYIPILDLEDCSPDNKIILKAETLDVFQSYCAGCHQPGGAGKASFEDILDLEEVVGVGSIVPGQPENSPLIQKLSEVDDPMPPNGLPSPTTDEIALLEAWVTCLDEPNAPPIDIPDPPEGLQEGDFVSISTLLKWMKDDLETLQLNEHKFIRYITFEHLFNSGGTFAEIELYGHGISKLVNSLSWKTKIMRPVAVDTNGLLLRIDIRDYGWDDLAVPLEEVDGKNVFLDLEAAYPYPLQYEGNDDAEFLVDSIQSNIPFIQGDWFAAKAAQPPLYHDILGLPDTRLELEELLGVDVQSNIDLFKSARAGFSFSNVSTNNRVIERHELGNNGNDALIGNYTGAYWVSYDFANNQGIKNIFQHPVDFSPDGNEVIFNLPNGFQAYYINNAQGDRINSAPTGIVSDPLNSPPDIVTGLSCMGCHYSGMKNAEDKVRYYVENYNDNYTADVIGKVQKLYPEQIVFDALMDADDLRFDDALANAWIPKATERSEEQIETLARSFDDKLSLTKVAATVGLDTDSFVNHPDIDRLKKARAEIADLVDNNAYIKREVFEESFRDVVCFLEIANPVNNATGESGCAIARLCNLDGDIEGDATLIVGGVELQALEGGCSPCRAIPVGDHVESTLIIGEFVNTTNENGQTSSSFEVLIDKIGELEVGDDLEGVINLIPIVEDGELMDVLIEVTPASSSLQTCDDLP